MSDLIACLTFRREGLETREAHTLIDYYTHKCIANKGARRIDAIEVIETLADVMLFEGSPNYIRSDNGPEMVAKVLRQSLTELGAFIYIEAVHYMEPFHCGKMATVSPSTASSQMNVCVAKSCAALKELKWSLGNGATTTTPNVRIHNLVTGRQRPKRSLDESSNMQ